ncbi:hypothetical protein CU097_015794 [Rhizopus azygosporus]|uniref:Uncharacterized protein n=1 Tax=Rhizopus azygosporus TaxID=86630 RepID=A0A367KF35_RHIAZ|nr:hypothetical protein CU097_015794 [Rhizopus azygosporus]
MLFKSVCFFLTLSLAAAATTDRGSYIVPNLGKRKQEILSSGGEVLDLAIAMLESDHMITDYAYGDNKSGDAANFGIFKQNWFMLRTSTSQFKGQPASDSNDGAVLNKDLKADIKARHESQKFYGTEKWFGGHRNGESGLNNSDTADINTYKSGVYWIQDQLSSDPKYLKDDTRFWVDVTPI